MKETIPDYIQKLFWDVKRDKVEINRHASFIIRRVLDFGNVFVRTYTNLSDTS